MDEMNPTNSAAEDREAKSSLARKAITVCVIAAFCLLTAAWLVLVTWGILGLVDWLIE